MTPCGENGVAAPDRSDVASIYCQVRDAAIHRPPSPRTRTGQPGRLTDSRDLQRLLQRAIEHQFGFRPQIINGSTAVGASRGDSRQSLIDAFQAQHGFGVLILSASAAGFGVNIQEANHVIHFTRAWNPAKEDQATDRAYRIGQRRDVHVYCPTVAGPGFASFEERLAERLDYKRELSRDMLVGIREVGVADFDDL